MADVMTPDERSALMSRIRGKNTTPEKAVRTMLWQEGFRFRLHVRALVGRPDIVLPKWNAVVLVHGCFWHAHTNCSLYRLPSTRTEFWKEKLASNHQRDLRTLSGLTEASWRVAVIWECAIRNDAQGLRTELCGWLRSDLQIIELAGRGKRLVLGPLPPLGQG